MRMGLVALAGVALLVLGAFACGSEGGSQTPLPRARLSEQEVVALVSERLCPDDPALVEDNLVPIADWRSGTWEVRYIGTLSPGAKFNVADESGDVSEENAAAGTLVSTLSREKSCGSPN